MINQQAIYCRNSTVGISGGISSVHMEARSKVLIDLLGLGYKDVGIITSTSEAAGGAVSVR